MRHRHVWLVSTPDIAYMCSPGEPALPLPSVPGRATGRRNPRIGIFVLAMPDRPRRYVSVPRRWMSTRGSAHVCWIAFDLSRHCYFDVCPYWKLTHNRWNSVERVGRTSSLRPLPYLVKNATVVGAAPAGNLAMIFYRNPTDHHDDKKNVGVFWVGPASPIRVSVITERMVDNYYSWERWVVHCRQG